ncbi:MAG: hypothetical protein ACRDRS_02125 [Pseudonocardiaceae bacterium]
MIVIDDRALRRWCKRELQALDLRPPLRVEVLCQRLGARQGRPIRLVAHPLPVPGPFGLWIGTESADYILYQSETTRIHQDHIILHEVGHIIAGHHNNDTGDEYWQQMMPDISPEIIRRALRRTYYDTAEEREAELLATIIMNIMGWTPATRGTGYVNQGRSDDLVVKRIQATLSKQQG